MGYQWRWDYGAGRRAMGRASRRADPLAPFRALIGDAYGDVWLPLPGYVFTDTAGTVPAQEDDQVAAWRGAINGLLAVQAETTARPYLRRSGEPWRLAFDGIDDRLAVASFAAGATNRMTLGAAATKRANVNNQLIVSFNGATPPSASVRAHGSGSFRATHRGDNVRFVDAAHGIGLPTTNVGTTISDRAAPILRLRLDGVQVATNADAPGATPDYGTHPLTFGARPDGVGPFEGDIFAAFARAGLPGDAELLAAEKAMGKLAGLTI